MMQLDLFAPRWTILDRLAQQGRQRIIDGMVDEWGKHSPVGPRKKLTPAQQRAYDLAVRGVPPGADNAGTPGPVR